MKTLYIHRHAKAVKEGYDNDFGRELSLKGIEEAHFMGRYLKQRDFLADVILTSPANRALKTAELVAEYTGERLIKDDRLYSGDWSALLSVLHAQERGLRSIRIVGHNPALEKLCMGLCGIRSGGIHLATCGVVCVSCDIDDWHALEENKGRLEWSVRPSHI